MNTLHAIVVIDDDAPLRNAVSNLLRSSGFDPHAYSSAEAFLAEGNYSKFDLIISDIKMPGMTGLDLQKTLLQRGIAIPIIFISAVLDAATIARATADGAIACLQKPFDDRDLMDVIDLELRGN